MQNVSIYVKPSARKCEDRKSLYKIQMVVDVLLFTEFSMEAFYTIAFS